jgi:transketolase
MVEYFGRALLEKAETTPELVVVDADVSDSTKTTYFREKYPDRFIQVGISEQDQVGVAAGLALSGKIPVAAGFATFLISRAYEQILNTVARQHLDVKLVGTHAGLSPSADGESHQSVNDIAITRVIPNMTVIIPADAVAAGYMTSESIDRKGSVYLRLSRGFTPSIYTDASKLKIGKVEPLRDGDDATLIATGNMVHVSIEAAEELRRKNISVGVLDMHTVKPLDLKAIIQYAGKTGRIITVEEHSIIGGLGSAISEVLSERKPIPISRVGINDEFGHSSLNYTALLEKYGLSKEKIVEAAEDLIRKY